ncbi:hypothetical protein AJ80_03448 [Polytolypa hystricis UAMH7299]|uniref:Survival Motor Neuron Gemin2-binding domain-containing protein n=1 Tax=Polytolypa hystricis (strain UAMH7299) TaxID=1447883 RepID=A0A2B7YIE5_POLH7|nr:hypothetical protein AJ80_03448 [Polytolypa hystricis UAMH7299]
MGKRKRSKKRPLTQGEIWDDSALIQSWEDALEEYKLYHSIQARGENVEDALREEEAKGRAESANGASNDGRAAADAYAETQGHLEWTEAFDEEDADVDMPETEASHVPEAAASRSAPEQAENAKPKLQATSAGGGFANMPQMVFGGASAAQDDGLRNLMMAWYFAGYYTGLHEGQQHAANQKP